MKPKIYTATPDDLSPPFKTESFCVDVVLAADYHELEEKCQQLAAENVGLKAAAEFATAPDMWIEQADGMLDYRYCDWYVDVLKAAMETPATDRIVAEAEARGIEKGIAHLEKKFSNIGVQIMNLQWLADSLREGAK